MSNYAEFSNFGLVFRGTYSASTTYYVNDVVTDGIASYVCKIRNTLNVPVTNTTNWGALAAPGAIGVATVGTGTNPVNFTLTTNGSTVTLNKL